jgi:hypothetical protein
MELYGRMILALMDCRTACRVVLTRHWRLSLSSGRLTMTRGLHMFTMLLGAPSSMLHGNGTIQTHRPRRCPTPANGENQMGGAKRTVTDDPLNDTSCGDVASQSQKLAAMDDEDFEARATAANPRAVDRLGRPCRPVTEWISIEPGRVLYGAAAVSNLRGCWYPIGDPKSPEFRFCNYAKEHGSYCEEHAKLCVRERWEPVL